jgi:hypothetical protein
MAVSLNFELNIGLDFGMIPTEKHLRRAHVDEPERIPQNEYRSSSECSGWTVDTA